MSKRILHFPVIIEQDEDGVAAEGCSEPVAG